MTIPTNKLFNQKLPSQILLYLGLIVIGLIIKLASLPVRTGDFVCYLEPWINFIKTHGYAQSFRYLFFDYTPSYIYLLIGIAKMGFNPLYSIKIVSICFEYITAFYIGKIAKIQTSSNKEIWLALILVPLLPTVILNSSYLSQCDSIYTAFIVGSIYFALQKRQIASVALLGIAFALKIQSAIILPFYFILLLKGNIKWYIFLIIPLVYILSILPAWMFGGNFLSLLTVYASQSNQYQFLTLNFPNIYIWINNDYYPTVKIIGVIFTAIFTLVNGIWLSKKTHHISFERLVNLAFLSAIIIPFILPGMHERYMYLGDVLGVLYFIVNRKNIHLPVGIQIVSLYSYIRCSRFNETLPMYPAFIIYLLVITYTVFDLISSLKKSNHEISQ